MAWQRVFEAKLQGGFQDSSVGGTYWLGYMDEIGEFLGLGLIDATS